MHEPLSTKLALALLSLAALAACSSPPTNPAPAPMGAAAPAPAAAAGPAPKPMPSGTRPPSTVSALPHLDPSNVLARQRVVYFAYDSDAIDAAGREVIERHARYLVTNPTLTLKVEGHADERGSSEYNLALGQRRAEAVRRALALLGVTEARIEATSWGEERPVDPAHDEAAWKVNRRGEIVYPSR